MFTSMSAAMDLTDFVNEQLTEFTDNNQVHMQEYLDATVGDLNSMWDSAFEQLEQNPIYAKGNGALCVQRHCSAEEAACLADQVCRENFNCAGGCDPDDSYCTF